MKSYNTILTKLKAAAILTFLISYNAYAQTDLTSPYSIFGPGIPNLPSTVSQYGMGGSGVALIDPYKMYYLNPAALAYYLEPIFETSGKGTVSTFTSNAGSYENNSFILNNLSLSFPINRGVWGLTIGLEPYTTVGYDVTTTISNSNLDTSPVVKYTGDGGINQAYIGTAYKVYSRLDSTGNATSLAIGSNLNFNFGTIDNIRLLTFPDDPSTLGLRLDESTLVRDINFDFGIHYQTNLIKKTFTNPSYLKLLAGATFSTGSDLNAQKSASSYNFNSVGQRGDTLSFLDEQNGSISLPVRVTLGVGLDYITAIRSRFRFSLDYSTQQWSNYSETFGDDLGIYNFQDSQTIGTGIEYTPSLGSTKYLRVVEYRAGFMYQQSNININGTEVNDIGMSFGLSLPIHHKRGLTKSAFHIAGQYGTYGTKDNGLIQEEYYKIFVGFSFTPHFRNRWFVQPKYD